MVLLIAEGSHYNFHLYDISRNAAMRRLRRAFNQHLREHQAPPARVEDALTINVIDPFISGVVYRDYAAMIEAPRVVAP